MHRRRQHRLPSTGSTGLLLLTGVEARLGTFLRSRPNEPVGAGSRWGTPRAPNPPVWGGAQTRRRGGGPNPPGRRGGPKPRSWGGAQRPPVWWGPRGAARRPGRPGRPPSPTPEIALLIGSTRETVTLVLGKLKREGLIAFERRRIILRDPKFGLSCSLPGARRRDQPRSPPGRRTGLGEGEHPRPGAPPPCTPKTARATASSKGYGRGSDLGRSSSAPQPSPGRRAGGRAITRRRGRGPPLGPDAAEHLGRARAPPGARRRRRRRRRAWAVAMSGDRLFGGGRCGHLAAAPRQKDQRRGREEQRLVIEEENRHGRGHESTAPSALPGGEPG